MSAFEPDQIEVTAIFGASTRRGFVQVEVLGQTTVLTPSKAREVASFLLEAAGAAEGDEAMMVVLGRMKLTQDMMLTQEEQVNFLMALRTEREKIDQRSRDEARQAIAYDRVNLDTPEETS